MDKKHELIEDEYKKNQKKKDKYNKKEKQDEFDKKNKKNNKEFNKKIKKIVIPPQEKDFDKKNTNLRIAVCIKQVPNTDKIKFDWKNGRIIRTKENNIINPDDLHAIEFALSIKELYGGTITAITLGPEDSKNILFETFAYGVDKAILITDPLFAGSDSLITSRILAKCIEKKGNFDIICTGFESIDGNTGQVSYQLSELLNIPHLTNLHQFGLNGNKVFAHRIFGHEFQKIQTTLPILVAMKKNDNRVRFPKLSAIQTCFSKEIEILSSRELGLNANECGSKGSPTITITGEQIKQKRKQIEFKGDIDSKIEELIQKLKKYDIINA